MGRTPNPFLVFLLIILTASPAAGAGFAKVGTYGFQWEGMFTGTRATALGQADLAGASGPNASFLNTAPLPSTDGIEGEYGRSNFFADTNLEAWAGSLDWRGWRLGFARARFFMDPQLFRTAYNPEGTGETFESGDDMNVISLGYDLGRAIDESGTWQWTLGAAYRGYHSFLAEAEIKETTWDLGTSAGWKTDHPLGQARMSAAVSWQNIFSEDFEFDEREAALPRSVRTGVTLESTFGAMDWGTEALRVLMAYSHRFIPESYGGRDTDHFGLEVVGVGFLAGRLGYNSRYPKGFNSWGLGVIFDQDFMGSFTVSADFGAFDIGFDELEMWSVRARYSF